MIEENPFSEGLPATVLDRSTLEREANCPQQAQLIESHNLSTGGDMADVGNECHRICSLAVRRRVELWPQMQIKDLIVEAANSSRPDLQPRVIVSLRAAAWKIAEIICRHDSGWERSPEDIIVYDGGDGEQSGQLAADIVPATETAGAIRITGEMDLLCASPSVEEVNLDDWKSGWKWWTPTEIGESFQFQCYSWLIFRNFPQVTKINVRVFMTAENTRTAPFTFERERHDYQIEKRILHAAQLYLQRKETGEAPPWPSPSKCALCPAASKCSYVHRPEGDLAIEPAEYLRQYVAVQAAADAMKAGLTSYVRANGDLIAGDLAFGANYPKTLRAPNCDVYRVSGSNDDDGGPAPERKPRKSPSPKRREPGGFSSVGGLKIPMPRRAPAPAPAPVAVEPAENNRLFNAESGTWAAIEDAAEPTGKPNVDVAAAESRTDELLNGH